MKQRVTKGSSNDRAQGGASFVFLRVNDHVVSDRSVQQCVRNENWNQKKREREGENAQWVVVLCTVHIYYHLIYPKQSENMPKHMSEWRNCHLNVQCRRQNLKRSVARFLQWIFVVCHRQNRQRVPFQRVKNPTNTKHRVLLLSWQCVPGFFVRSIVLPFEGMSM